MIGRRASILFDDTYKHAVWNKTEETRVVLFCDIFRTDLPKICQPINRWVYSLREKRSEAQESIEECGSPSRSIS